MKFAHFELDGESRFGLMRGNSFYTLLKGEAGPEVSSIHDLMSWPYQEDLIDHILRSDYSEGYLSAAMPAEDNRIRFLPCVPAPGKIICVGLNYKKHAIETGAPIPKEPVIFGKYSDAIAAHGDTIRIPATTRQLDYEGELGILIGKDTFNVDESEALEHVFGYFPANDVSARDLQLKTSQWLLGKTLDGFCPIGPYVVHRSAVPEPNKLTIQTKVNNEIRQNSSTSDMIFGCSHLISYISKYVRMLPGDIVLTGTPSGVILGKQEAERKWLQSGDSVSVTIEGLGTLTNTFI